jgi:hypothetical protein
MLDAPFMRGSIAEELDVHHCLVPKAVYSEYRAGASNPNLKKR